MKTTGFLAILLVCVSCELDSLVDVEELDSNRNGNNIEIFASGVLTTQYKHHYVRIRKPQSIYGGKREDLPIKGANVYLISGNDTVFYEENYFKSQAGSYRTIIETKAEPNIDYTLHIEFMGETYTATDKAPPVESIEFGEVPVPEFYIYHLGWYFLIIRRHYFGYQQPFYWRWYSLAYTETGNYLDSDYSVSAYLHQGILPQGIYGSNVENKNDNSNFGTSLNDSVIAAKYSLSQNNYNYLKAFFIETEWTDSEYRTIPANLPTNFSNGAAGFFSVRDHKVLRLTVKDILDFHGTEYPEEDSNNGE